MARSNTTVMKDYVLDLQHSLKLAHWNVRSLNNYEGDISEVMNKRDIDVMGICETRLYDSGMRCAGAYNIIHTPCDKGIGGCSLIYNKSKLEVMTYECLTNRLLMAKFQVRRSTKKLCIIACYAPTEEKAGEEEVNDHFFNQLGNIIKSQTGWPTIVIGDLNARTSVEVREASSKFGPHSLGNETNNNGFRLLELVEKYNLRVMNTMFKKSESRLATWRHPRQGVPPSTLDYLLSSPGLTWLDVRSSWGDAGHSDHAMLIGIMRWNRGNNSTSKCTRWNRGNNSTSKCTSTEKGKRGPKAPPKIQLRDLINKVLGSESAKKNLSKQVEKLPTDISNDDLVTKLQELVTAEAKNIPGKDKIDKCWYEYLSPQHKKALSERKTAYELWLRNKSSSSLSQSLKTANKEARKAIKEAQDLMLQAELTKFEDLLHEKDLREAYLILKRVLGKRGAGWVHNLKTPCEVTDGKFAEHYSNLFKESCPENCSADAVIEAWGSSEIRPDIDPLDEEYSWLNRELDPMRRLGPPSYGDVLTAIRELKGGKAPGTNGITADLIKLLGEELTPILTCMFSSCWYKPKDIPQAWRDAKIFSLFKKGARNDPNNYRSIFLLDTIGKVFARCINNWIASNVLGECGWYQFGFRRGRSTSQAVLLVRRRIQRALDNNDALVVTFIDLKKAFDSVKRPTLWLALEHFKIPVDMIGVIQSLHTIPVASVGECQIKIEKGVRQGCVLGPTLFILAFHYILHCLDCSETDDDKVAYADDLAILAKTLNSAQKKLDQLQVALKDTGLEIAASKTKYFCVNQAPTEQTPLTVGNETIEMVKRFDYLGSGTNPVGTNNDAIRTNCEKARVALIKQRKVLVSEVSLKTKALILEVFVKTPLIHGLETMIIRHTDFAKLDAVINRGKRMCLKLSSRREVKVVDLNEKIKTLPLPLQIGSRRVNLYCTLKQLNLPIQPYLASRVHQKDWLRQVRTDLENLGVEAIDEWLNNPSPLKPKASECVGLDLPTRMVGKRDLIIECINDNCNRLFATKKEMLRHFRNDHTLSNGRPTGTCMSDSPKGTDSNQTNGHLYCCPLPDCTKEYKVKGWYIRHLRTCHGITAPSHPTETENSPPSPPHREETMIVADDKAVSPDLSGQCDENQAVQEGMSTTLVCGAKDMPNNATTGLSKEVTLNTYGMLKCPHCPYSARIIKTLNNHTTAKHRWSVITGRPVRQRMTRVKRRAPLLTLLTGDNPTRDAPNGNGPKREH